MGFESDTRVKEEVRRLEGQQRSENEAAERLANADRRRRMSRAVKNRILFYTALIFAVVLVWQKLHIVIFIPGSFTALFIILGGIFLALYLGLQFLFRGD